MWFCCNVQGLSLLLFYLLTRITQTWQVFITDYETIRIYGTYLNSLSVGGRSTFVEAKTGFVTFLICFFNFYKTTIFRSLFYKAALPGLSSSSILSLQKELKAKEVLRIRIRIRIPVLLPLSTFINTANYNGITSASQKRKKNLMIIGQKLR